jgi:NADPH2:quinone reductase
MKAFQIKYHAHPREHKVCVCDVYCANGSSDIPPPVPGPGQVLVDVYASGLNFFDVLQAQNLYQRGCPSPLLCSPPLR